MNANDITFGVELEVTVPFGSVSVGGYHNGIQIQGLPEGWNAQHDGSIRTGRGWRRSRARQGAEIVSPVLKGADGLRQVKAVCQWLKQIGAKVNPSCGLHVHIGFDKSNAEALKAVVTAVANFEKAIYASTGTKSRERGCFCHSVKYSTSHQGAFRDGQSVYGYRANGHSRYHILNIMPHTPTIEFRAFAGTTNAVKVMAAILTCVAIVEKALKQKKAPKWDAKKPVETSPIHRKGGEGQTELNRLFYWLGWTKGRVNTPYGAIAGEGLPTIKRCKKELMRLAQKYDSRP